MNASGQATVDFAGDMLLPAARIRIESLDLANALPAYVQPFLIDSAFKDITGAGTIRGDVEIQQWPADSCGARPRVGHDRQRSGRGLTRGNERQGQLVRRCVAYRACRERSTTTLFLSRLSWKAGHLWGLELGPAELPFATTGRHFRLLEPVKLPIFDGGLAVETLRVRHAGTDDMYVRFDAAIEPISVSLLSRAFGWPEFQGKLAGSIPGLQLRQGVVTLDGNLEASSLRWPRRGKGPEPQRAAREVPAHAREHRHRGPRSRARHADVRVRHDHRPAVRAASRTSRHSAGCRRPSTLSSTRRRTTTRSTGSASAQSRTCRASAAAAAAASQRHSRAAS